MRTLIVGCGYVGLELGRRLAAAGHDVSGLRRSLEAADELRAVGIKPIAGDITCPADLAHLPGSFDWVVNTVSSSKGGADVYREVYLHGTRNLLDWLAAAPPAKFVHVSSTSVYGQTDGSVVTEASATESSGEAARLLVDTEDLLLAAAREHGFPAVVLRVAGIYGPGRGHLFHQFLRGEARIQGDGSRLLNMIHRDDVAAAIQCALERGSAGEIYNVADDEPVTQLEFLRWLAGQLNRPLPPHATGAEDARRKRGLTSKRVSNAKLRALGWQPRYPTWREGYAGEIEVARGAT